MSINIPMNVTKFYIWNETELYVLKLDRSYTEVSTLMLFRTIFKKAKKAWKQNITSLINEYYFMFFWCYSDIKALRWCTWCLMTLKLFGPPYSVPSRKYQVNNFNWQLLWLCNFPLKLRTAKFWCKYTSFFIKKILFQRCV